MVAWFSYCLSCAGGRQPPAARHSGKASGSSDGKIFRGTQTTIGGGTGMARRVEMPLELACGLIYAQLKALHCRFGASAWIGWFPQDIYQAAWLYLTRLRNNLASWPRPIWLQRGVPTSLLSAFLDLVRHIDIIQT